jgi:transposase
MSTVKRRRRSYAPPPELAQRRALTAALYRQGYKYEDIAERLGIALATVHKDLVCTQTQRRTPWQMQKRLTPRNRIIAAAYDAYGGLKEVAAEFGISKQQAGEHVRRVRKLG